MQNTRPIQSSYGFGLLLVGLIFAVLAPLSGFPAQPPDHPILNPSLRQMAEFHLLQRRYDEALKNFRETLEKGERDGYIFRGLVNAYRGANRQVDGEVYLKQQLRIFPQSAAFYGLGYLYYLEGRDDEAERRFRQAVDADPRNALALNNLGAVIARKKLYLKAVRLVKEAIEIDPGELMFFRNLQIIYGEMGLASRFSDEFEEYKKKKGSLEIIAGYGKTLATSLRQKGFLFFSQGKLDQAIKSFLDLVVIYQGINYKEGIVPGLFSLGLLYEEKGNWEQALKYFHDVLKISPNHIQAREKVKATEGG